MTVRPEGKHDMQIEKKKKKQQAKNFSNMKT